MATYNGYFRGKYDAQYHVKITTKTGTFSKEVTLGGKPFVTSMDNSDDTIYKPAKYQTATIELVTDDYLFDIYNGEAQAVSVQLYTTASDILQWTGYVRPNLFDMGFEKRREVIEVECQDGLSTLQYFPYRQTDKQVRSFWYIINKLIKLCGCYKRFFISNNTFVRSDYPVLNDLYISERNFFDDKNEHETDDDAAWKCDDVLEEICQYLNVTAIALGDEVYFIDYDALKTGNTYFWHYEIDNEKPMLIDRRQIKTIKAKDYSANGATISLDNVYNKVTVKDEFNNYDSIVPSLYDNLENITDDSDTELLNSHTGTIVKSTVGDGTNNNMIVFIDDFGKMAYAAVAAKYFKSNVYKTYDYTGKGDKINYTDTKTMQGSVFAKFFAKKVDIDKKDGWTALLTGKPSPDTIDQWFAKNNIGKIELSNYLVLLNPSTNHISNDDITKYPFLTTNVSDNTMLFGGKNAYLLINGSYWYSSMDGYPYPVTSSEWGIDLDEGRYAMHKEDTHLVCKLQIGDSYWNGTSWQTNECTFDLPYMNEMDDRKRRADATMWKDLKIPTTVSWRIGTTEDGYAVKLPEDRLLVGNPQLTIYKPYDPNYKSTKSHEEKGQWYKHDIVLLKDFDIKAIIGDPTYSDRTETDTQYSITIDGNYANELSDISYKITTNDAKKPSYSDVAIKDGNKYVWLDNIHNSALASDVNGMTYTNSSNVKVQSDGTLRPEWWLIYRIYKQYQQPSVKLHMSLRNDILPFELIKVHDMGDKEFIVDNINIDYKNDSTEVTLIEKK